MTLTTGSASSYGSAGNGGSGSEPSGEELYSSTEVFQIFRGYRMLDATGAMSSMLARAARCHRCSERYPERSDLPVNVLVRPLPLDTLGTPEAAERYWIRLRRDHGFLRNRLDEGITAQQADAHCAA